MSDELVAKWQKERPMRESPRPPSTVLSPEEERAKQEWSDGLTGALIKGLNKAAGFEDEKD